MYVIIVTIGDNWSIVQNHMTKPQHDDACLRLDVKQNIGSID